jgi:hypothetical protein
MATNGGRRWGNFSRQALKARLSTPIHTRKPLLFILQLTWLAVGPRAGC